MTPTPVANSGYTTYLTTEGAEPDTDTLITLQTFLHSDVDVHVVPIFAFYSAWSESSAVPTMNLETTITVEVEDECIITGWVYNPIEQPLHNYLVNEAAHYFDINIDYLPAECNYEKVGYSITIGGGSSAPSWISVDDVTYDPQHRVRI